MQVRHIEQDQMVLDKAEKLDPELLPALRDEKPWEEVLECLAVLAAIHAQPCQAALERHEEEDRDAEPEDNDPDEK